MDLRGKLVIIIGGTGTGKTTLAKKLLSKSENNLIYDINNEYSDIKGVKTYCTVQKFIEVVNSYSNCIVMMDEASIFMGHSSNAENVRMMLGLKRHSFNGFILNFHAINQVPIYLLNYADVIFIKKTNDNIKYVKRFNGQMDGFYDLKMIVQDSPNKYITGFINPRTLQTAIFE